MHSKSEPSEHPRQASEPNAVPRAVLKQYWGYEAFRPGQEEIVHAVLEGHPTLALLPTGGGKSLCYQVPAMILEGLCLVISPLIALMNDQVARLNRMQIPAAALVSGLAPSEAEAILERARQGRLKFLYLSPERLANKDFVTQSRDWKLALVAVDEAHCIAQWGHDFRPEYRRIKAFLEGYPLVRLLALTASATPAVCNEITEALGMSRARVVRQSFARPFLHYLWYQDPSKHRLLQEALQGLEGKALVYVRSRRQSENIAGFLSQKGIGVQAYHAGLSPELRDTRQKNWMSHRYPVMVCTTAFGMGIDQADVRLVFHWDLPESPEAYYQEAGRAGRDGGTAVCLMPWTAEDLAEAEQRLKDAFPPPKRILKIYQALGQFCNLAVGSGLGQRFEFDPAVFCHRFEFAATEVHHSLQILHRAGLIAVAEEALLPSRLRFVVSAKRLYELRLREPSLDPYIDLLLRNFPGILDQFVRFDEHRLGRQAGITAVSIVQAVHLLQEKGVLEYLPRSDKQGLVWTCERLGPDHFHLPRSAYQDLLHQRKERLSSWTHMVAARDGCRSQLLLSYFGETDSMPCGRCDLCRARAVPSGDLSADEVVRLADSIRPLLQQPLSPKALLQELDKGVPPLPPEAVHRRTEALRWLIERGTLHLDADQRVAWAGAVPHPTKERSSRHGESTS